jgi:hypothetical protein
MRCAELMMIDIHPLFCVLCLSVCSIMCCLRSFCLVMGSTVVEAQLLLDYILYF